MNIEELQNLIDNIDYHKFIETNLTVDANVLRLKNISNISFDVKFAILQIDCKNRIKKKLPEIFANKTFLFPSIISTEQCTAQEIAEFHSTLINENDTVLDLTAGLCIDTFYISKKAKNVTAIEINEDTATVAKFNMQNMRNNVNVINIDCTEYIKECSQKYDVIFIDPARRGENNKRLYSLSDCKPNVLDLLPVLKQIGNYLYIKASSMIDINQSIKELNNIVSDVWVLGINNECKELLFKVDLRAKDIIKSAIHTINFMNIVRQELSETKYNIALDCICSCSLEPNIFLYEPNSCIMKAGIFSTISTIYNISQIQSNSHLFISDRLIEDFPGRKFKILEIVPFKSKDIKYLKIKYPQMNISVRNFKLTANELKNKLKVNDGGDIYMFGTTDKDNNAVLLICNKV